MSDVVSVIMLNDADIKTLQRFYSGFFITDPVGNNAFSFVQRQSKSIYVPPFVRGGTEALCVGEQIAFSEVVEGHEKNFPGLKQFVYMEYHGKDVFFFDNHNHAFFFWLYAVITRRLVPGGRLVHIDQHRDLRNPPSELDQRALDSGNIQEIFDYTVHQLNVGNFIKPALTLGVFRDVEMIDNKAAFQKSVPGPFVLDLDMDIFSPSMQYIEQDLKIARIKEYLQDASFVTVATSPFFMDQQEAITLIRQLFGEIRG